MENNMFGLRKEIIDEIKAISQKYDYDFYIFGSRARGDFKHNSDIDIAIFDYVTEEDERKIRNEFDKIDMEYILDIVFVNQLNNKDLIDNIQKEGVLIK